MTNRERADYHGRVMNLTGDYYNSLAEYDNPELRTAYKMGHRDARHAAAEVVGDLEAERDELLAVLIDRDGGVHDMDCKVHNPHVRVCNCGHEEAQQLIAKAYGEEDAAMVAPRAGAEDDDLIAELRVALRNCVLSLERYDSGHPYIADAMVAINKAEGDNQ